MKTKEENIKISERNFNIYKYLIKNEPQTVIELSEAFGLTRTTVYKILEKLMKEKVVVKSGKVFNASHPRVFLNRLTEEENRISGQKEILNNLLSDNFGKKVKIFYKDKSFANLNRELRKSPVKIGYIFLNSDLIPKELVSRRSKEKFTEDVIINFSNKGKKIRQVNKKNIYLKYKRQKNFVAVSIFGKKVAFYSIQQNGSNVGILIEDEGIANILMDIADTVAVSKK